MTKNTFSLEERICALEALAGSLLLHTSKQVEYSSEFLKEIKATALSLMVRRSSAYDPTDDANQSLSSLFKSLSGDPRL